MPSDSREGGKNERSRSRLGSTCLHLILLMITCVGCCLERPRIPGEQECVRMRVLVDPRYHRMGSEALLVSVIDDSVQIERCRETIERLGRCWRTLVILPYYPACKYIVRFETDDRDDIGATFHIGEDLIWGVSLHRASGGTVFLDGRHKSLTESERAEILSILGVEDTPE